MKRSLEDDDNNNNNNNNNNSKARKLQGSMGHIADCLRANERLETTLQASDTCLEDFGGMFINVYTI